MEEAAGDDVVYVAVGKVVEDSKLTLLWASNNFKLNTLCILHFYQPAKRHKSSSVGRYSTSGTEEHGIKEFEKKIMIPRVMDEYALICHRAGVPRDKLVKLPIEMDDTAKGIVELIRERNIKKFVMGAAADKHYFEGMVDLKSEKAQYVYRHVPLFCQVWFICQGKLIRLMSRAETGRSSSASSFSASASDVTSNSDMTMLERIAENESGVDSHMVLYSGEDLDDLPTNNFLQDENSDEGLYDQLEQALVEAEKAKREAFEESMRRVKAEKSYVGAMRQATEFKRLYTDSRRSMRETELALAELKEELQNIKQERDREHLISLDQKKLMETQLTSSEYMINELEQKLSSALEQLNICQEERDNLQAELGDAEKRIDEIFTRQEEESSNEHGQQFFYEFSVSEIQNATNDFEPSLKIGAGVYGSIYKGSLHHTTVAIKVLRQSSLQGPSEFQEEVELLSRLRHPNLVTLIGTCPEIWALIYEYLPNGSLEDRLSCRDDTDPLSWQTRIQIATELCLVLIFLRSCKPHGIVHGNLKPSNILLDANFVCKLSDFGVCSAFPHLQNSSSMNDPSNISSYTDPEFYTTGVFSPSSDIYSFGIILLQLLTGNGPLDIAEHVQHALNVGELNEFLDQSAGCWPYVHAAQLSHLALRCSATSRSRRPDLASEVLPVLEQIRTSSGASSSFDSAVEDDREPPSYFMCPISQEIMNDPHVAADGFTYEANTLREWLQHGHNTSPMTNIRLAHCNLIPNHALRSAIQEWMQQR